jgi:hypothetical protein
VDALRASFAPFAEVSVKAGEHGGKYLSNSRRRGRTKFRETSAGSRRPSVACHIRSAVPMISVRLAATRGVSIARDCPGRRSLSMKRIEPDDESPIENRPSPDSYGAEHRAAATIGRLLAEATVADVRRRLEVGCLILRLRSQSEPPRLDTVARLLGCSTKILYQHGLVAERFRGIKLDAWFATADARPPTWSHLVALAAIPSKSARMAALHDCVMRPTSVRALTGRIQESRQARVRQTV